MDRPARNALAALTRPECDYFREHCNFTEEELRIFNLRVRDKSVAHISMDMCLSERTVNRRIKGIKNKMCKLT